MRMTALPFLAACAALLMGGCSRHANRAECTAMIDKYIDMEIGRSDDVGRAPERERPAIIETKKAQKRGEESYKKALAKCEAEVRTSELECAMKAPSPESWQACID
jgi:hypothetical protein